MRCPMCRTKLLGLDRDGVEVDYCPACQGVWLDGGELNALAERHGLYDRAKASVDDGGGGGGEDDDGDRADTPADAGALVWDAIFRRELLVLAPEELRAMGGHEPYGRHGNPAYDADPEPAPQSGGLPAPASGPPAEQVPRCPVCSQTLTVSWRHRVRLDVCSNCRGMWFDPGELELVLQRHGRAAGGGGGGP